MPNAITDQITRNVIDGYRAELERALCDPRPPGFPDWLPWGITSMIETDEDEDIVGAQFTIHTAKTEWLSELHRRADDLTTTKIMLDVCHRCEVTCGFSVGACIVLTSPKLERNVAPARVARLITVEASINAIKSAIRAAEL